MDLRSIGSLWLLCTTEDQAIDLPEFNDIYIYGDMMMRTEGQSQPSEEIFVLSPSSYTHYVNNRKVFINTVACKPHLTRLPDDSVHRVDMIGDVILLCTTPTITKCMLLCNVKYTPTAPQSYVGAASFWQHGWDLVNPGSDSSHFAHEDDLETVGFTATKIRKFVSSEVYGATTWFLNLDPRTFTGQMTGTFPVILEPKEAFSHPVACYVQNSRDVPLVEESFEEVSTSICFPVSPTISTSTTSMALDSGIHMLGREESMGAAQQPLLPSNVDPKLSDSEVGPGDPAARAGYWSVATGWSGNGPAAQEHTVGNLVVGAGGKAAQAEKIPVMTGTLQTDRGARAPRLDLRSAAISAPGAGDKASDFRLLEQLWSISMHALMYAATWIVLSYVTMHVFEMHVFDIRSLGTT